MLNPARLPDDPLPMHSRRDVAPIGRARPPVVFMTSIALGVALQVAAPWRLDLGGAGTTLGVIVAIAACALFITAVRQFRRAGTPVPARQPTTAIVRRGPYRWTRNPIYLSFILFQAGLALLLNSVWLLILLVPPAALIVFVVVPREERYLETRFPDEYGSYRASVRRWL